MQSHYIAIFLFAIALAGFADGAPLDERPLAGLQRFIDGDGQHPEFIEGFENEAVRTIIERLKSEPKVDSQASMLWALDNSLRQIKNLDPQLVAAAKATIHARLDGREPGTRRLAMGFVAVREGDAGLNLIGPMLNDPIEEVRITAANMFGSYGAEARIAQLEAVLAERAKGLSAEQIKRDYSFRHGYAAIEKLKQRWQQPVAERVEPRRALSQPTTSSSTPTPIAPRVLSQAPAETVAQASPAVAERKSSVWLWGVGLIALAVIGRLVLKRRS